MRNLKIAIAVAAVLACVVAAAVGIVLTGIKRSYEIVNRNDIYK